MTSHKDHGLDLGREYNQKHVVICIFTGILALPSHIILFDEETNAGLGEDTTIDSEMVRISLGCNYWGAKNPYRRYNSSD